MHLGGEAPQICWSLPERVLDMVKIGKKEKNGELYKAILLLKDEQ